MKLVYCIDCKALNSVHSGIAQVCNCTHCFYRRTIGNKINIFGPCKVYALTNSTLNDDRTKLWRIKLPHPEVEVFTQLTEQFYF